MVRLREGAFSDTLMMMKEESKLATACTPNEK